MKVALSHQHGGSEVLKHTDFPMPKPKSGEALIRLGAVALKRMDGMVHKNDCGRRKISGRSPWIFIDEAIPLV